MTTTRIDARVLRDRDVFQIPGNTGFYLATRVHYESPLVAVDFHPLGHPEMPQRRAFMGRSTLTLVV
jgi:hypothetical protein